MSSESSVHAAASNQPSFFTFCQVKIAEVKLGVDPEKITPETPDFQIVHDKLVELWLALSLEERNVRFFPHIP